MRTVHTVVAGNSGSAPGRLLPIRGRWSRQPTLTPQGHGEGSGSRGDADGHNSRAVVLSRGGRCWLLHIASLYRLSNKIVFYHFVKTNILRGVFLPSLTAMPNMRSWGATDRPPASPTGGGLHPTVVGSGGPRPCPRLDSCRPRAAAPPPRSRHDVALVDAVPDVARRQHCLMPHGVASGVCARRRPPPVWLATRLRPASARRPACMAKVRLSPLPPPCPHSPVGGPRRRRRRRLGG